LYLLLENINALPVKPGEIVIQRFGRNGGNKLCYAFRPQAITFTGK
jgi:hypothetical protein